MIIDISVGLLVAIIAASVITNPFSRLGIVYRPYVASPDGDVIVGVDNNHKIIVRDSLWWRFFAWTKSGIYVMESRYLNSPRSKSKTLNGIIGDIHKLRYNPHKLLLISGDHFRSLYPRNLGVFYYPMLDRHIISAHEDWDNRQLVYLQTVAFALGVFAKQKHLATTLVPTGRHGVTCINSYAYPSDSLYGILYALAALSGLETARPYAYASTNSGGKTTQKLKTVAATTALLADYKPSLQSLYESYRLKAYDERTGFIKTGVHLSGAKDITRRRSAFYDNVILWKTTQLAQTLGLIEPNKPWLNAYKKRILKTFWLPQEGYFLEDLSHEGIAHKYYSSDWLAVLFTGFLSPASRSERHYFTRSVSYIEQQGIDRPFAIKYQQDTRAHRQFLVARVAVASYGGDAIWSFWGMEYIKLLLLLYRLTGDDHYLKKADFHIGKYKHAMLQNNGFPEVYDAKGRLLQTPLYRSIRQTGWVIGFEQVLAIRHSLAV